MFIGSITRYMRAVLETAAGAWKGLPVYVACSGNFTVERILARCGVGAIHSNDVSIYSCALGWHLASRDASRGCAWPGQGCRVKSLDHSWLESHMDPGPATIATLLLAGEMLKVGGDPSTGSGRDNAYAMRMREQYRRKWPQLHARTVERVKKATAGLSIAEYFAGDFRRVYVSCLRCGFKRPWTALAALNDREIDRTTWEPRPPARYNHQMLVNRTPRPWPPVASAPRSAIAGVSPGRSPA